LDDKFTNDCGIDDQGIKILKLIELYADYNLNITNVSHMTNLKILNASGYSGIYILKIKL